MLALLVLVIAALAALLFVYGADADALAQIPAAAIALAVIGTLLALYVATLRGRYREAGSGHGLRLALLALFVVSTAGLYFFVPQLISNLPLPNFQGADSVIAERPHQSASVRLRRSGDGRIFAKGRINDAAVDLLVDSGSTAVILKASDAERAGIDIAASVYDTPLATAAGQTFVAPIRLRRLEIGPIRVDDVDAFIAKPGSINENLLGMSFLRRLSSYEVSGEFATLRQ